MALSNLHLVLNHVPVIGALIAFGVLLLALVRRSDDLRRAGLEVFVLFGLLTLPAYLSGLGAQREIAKHPEGIIEFQTAKSLEFVNRRILRRSDAEADEDDRPVEGQPVEVAS